MALTSVAIIIPTRNRHELLRRCLNRLTPYVSVHPECSVVVSDDGNAAETRDALSGSGISVKVVQGPRRGPAANRNCGAAHSIAELLIFLDDDCIPEMDLIATYQNSATGNPEIGVFEGRITAEGEASSFADAAPANETGGYLWSCNFAIRRSLFLTIGGFDDRYPFPAMEDVDLHFRVKRHSEILFLPHARVWHAFEKRLGWKVVKHHALSLLLYLHIHGLRETEKGPTYFLRGAAKMTIEGGLRQFKRHSAKYPLQQVFLVWVNLQLATITALWGHHGYLARICFPPCCPSCESIHARLAGD